MYTSSVTVLPVTLAYIPPFCLVLVGCFLTLVGWMAFVAVSVENKSPKIER